MSLPVLEEDAAEGERDDVEVARSAIEGRRRPWVTIGLSEEKAPLGSFRVRPTLPLALLVVSLYGGVGMPDPLRSAAVEEEGCKDDLRL